MKQKIIFRSKAKHLEPVVIIGKSGLTLGTINEIKKIAKKRKLIKVKILSSALKNNKKELIKAIVEKTNTSLIEAVGNVVVLYYKPGTI